MSTPCTHIQLAFEQEAQRFSTTTPHIEKGREFYALYFDISWRKVPSKTIWWRSRITNFILTMSM